mgnify:CR=1 FL=1
MECIYCGKDTIIIDSRHQKTLNLVRRRRECKECNKRFTTIESVAYNLLDIKEVSKLCEKIDDLIEYSETLRVSMLRIKELESNRNKKNTYSSSIPKVNILNQKELTKLIKGIK